MVGWGEVEVEVVVGGELEEDGHSEEVQGGGETRCRRCQVRCQVR